MGNPIYILAGQSNANAMKDEFIAALQGANINGTYHAAIVADGGAPLTWQRGKADWMNHTELREDLYDTIKNILTADPDAYMGGIIWVQGEADTYQIARADQYAQSLQQLVQGVRNGLAQDFPDRDTGHDTFGLIISELSGNAPDADTRLNWNTIRDQQVAASESSDNIALVNPDTTALLNGYNANTMFKDGLHYSNAFQQTLMNTLVAELAAQQPLNPINGNNAKNFLKGTDYADHILGLAGNDLLVGGAGHDILAGGTGWDRLRGGAGSDTFVFTDEDKRWGERILDFENNTDTILIDTETALSFNDLKVFEHKTIDGTVVNYGAGSFILMGIDMPMVDASDFDFI